MEDDWLEEFNKPKVKPAEVPVAEKAAVIPEPVKEVFLREPPPSLVHTDSLTQYVVISNEIQSVLRMPEWVMERLNYLFLSKNHVVIIAVDPRVRTHNGPAQVLGYGIMRAMGKREVEVGWLRVWKISFEQLSSQNIVSVSLQRSIRGQSLYEEIPNVQGRGICRLMDKLVFNSLDVEYNNEREFVITSTRARFAKRFQNDAEIQLAISSYEEYENIWQAAQPAGPVPAFRVLHS
jgi:hypothetical protein